MHVREVVVTPTSAEVASSPSARITFNSAERTSRTQVVVALQCPPSIMVRRQGRQHRQARAWEKECVFAGRV